MTLSFEFPSKILVIILYLFRIIQCLSSIIVSRVFGSSLMDLIWSDHLICAHTIVRGSFELLGTVTVETTLVLRVLIHTLLQGSTHPTTLRSQMEIRLNDVALVSLNVINTAQKSAVVLKMLDERSLARHPISRRIDSAARAVLAASRLVVSAWEVASVVYMAKN